jgi:putative PIG3 family NAD(P)H quinone oxidoreductase
MADDVKMNVVAIESPGGPEALVPSTGDVPEPGEGEVRIRVAAAGVNRPDVLQRKGLYPVPPDASPLPGLEVAGIVDAVGRGVDEAHVGERVTALCNGGGYAEQVAVPWGQVLPVPGDLSWVQAAALPETFFTVWVNVFDHGHLGKGESLLVHGGTSGIGTAAIQLGKAFGAKVFVTAGTDDKCAKSIALGADGAVNYREKDFVTEIRALSDGVDVVLDMVGGDYVPRNLQLLRDRGRHVSIAFLRGPTCELSLFAVMSKRLVLTGSTLRPRTREEKAAIAESLRERVWPLLADGKIAPVIDSTFPLAEAAKAHERMESSKHIGKIVLRVNDEL